MFKHVLNNPRLYNFGDMASSKQVNALNREVLASMTNRKTLEDLLEQSLDEDIILTQEMAMFYLKIVEREKTD